MGNLPGARMEPVCPALAGGFLTTGPPGKSWRFRTGKGCLPSLPALMASPCQRHFALPRAKLCVWGHPGRATTEQNFSQKKEGLRPVGGIPEHPSPLPVVSQLLGQPGGIESISGRGHLWTHSPSWTSLEMFTTLRTPLRSCKPGGLKSLSQSVPASCFKIYAITKLYLLETMSGDSFPDLRVQTSGLTSRLLLERNSREGEKNYWEATSFQHLHLSHSSTPSPAREARILNHWPRCASKPIFSIKALRLFRGLLKKFEIGNHSIDYEYKKLTAHPTWIDQLNSSIMRSNAPCSLHISGIHRALETVNISL